jgi:hypothetical protein
MGLVVKATPRPLYLEKDPVPTVWGTLLVAQLVEALRYKPEGRRFD